VLVNAKRYVSLQEANPALFLCRQAPVSCKVVVVYLQGPTVSVNQTERHPEGGSSCLWNVEKNIHVWLLMHLRLLRCFCLITPDGWGLVEESRHKG
jgi:hypothetical protein